MAQETACTECWKKSKSRTLSKELTAERASVQEDALEDQERSQLPVLRGPEKQIEWAVRLRYEFLQDLRVNNVESGTMTEEQFDAEILSLARRVGRAKWWIDNREAGDDLVELQMLATSTRDQREPILS